MWHSELRNHAGSKRTSEETTKKYIFTIEAQTRLHAEHITDLSFAAVRLKTIHASKLPNNNKNKVQYALQSVD